MSESLFHPFAAKDRPFSASTRGYVGEPDRRVPIPKQAPNGTFTYGVAKGVESVRKGLEFAVEYRRNSEIRSLKEQVEAQLPKGTEVDLVVSGYEFFGDGFSSIGVVSPDTDVLTESNPISSGRTSRIRISGKGNSSQVPDSVVLQNQSGETVKVPVKTGSPNPTPPMRQPNPSTRSVDDRPSVIDRIERGEVIRIDRDSMNRQERDFFEHDRVWA